MRLRRLTGFILTLLTLHLNLLGADFACAKHAPSKTGDATQPVMPATAVMPSAASSHRQAHALTETAAPMDESISAPNEANEQPPCDVPVQPNCCKALASCNVVFSSDHALDVAGILNVSELIAPNAMSAPPSERAAPEPPPPKA